MNYKYCYIFDFAAENICRLDLQAAEKKPEDFKDNEDIIRYWGFNPDQCHWMFSNEELDIDFIGSPIKVIAKIDYIN